MLRACLDDDADLANLPDLEDLPEVLFSAMNVSPQTSHYTWAVAEASSAVEDSAESEALFLFLGGVMVAKNGKTGSLSGMRTSKQVSKSDKQTNK